MCCFFLCIKEPWQLRLNLSTPLGKIAAQRLCSTRRRIQRRIASQYEFGLPFPPWMAYTFAKEMPHQIKLLLTVSCILAMCSCATVIVRSDNAPPCHVFPATKFDAEAFWAMGVKGEPPLTMADPSLKNGPGERLAYGAGAVIDCPFSVVTDLIFLPSDLIRIGQSKDEKKNPGEQFVDDNPS
jgi:uncharacterized protein YceK